MVDFSLLLMMLIGDFGKVLLIESCWTICVDRAEEMTRGAVSGKMTQLEGLQTVKCDGDTISYDTSLSTFTSGHVSLIMMFHWNHVGWPRAMGGKTKIAKQGFAQEHSNGTGDTADLDDSCRRRTRRTRRSRRSGQAGQ